MYNNRLKVINSFANGNNTGSVSWELVNRNYLIGKESYVTIKKNELNN